MMIVRIISVLLLSLIVVYAAPPDWDSVNWGNIGDAKKDGRSTGSGMGSYKSSNTVRDNLQNPLMSGNRGMTTLGATYQCDDDPNPFADKTECDTVCGKPCQQYRFDALLQCPSNTAAITIKPISFSAGGEVTLRVEFDTNLDGTMDRSFTTANISGFCMNGYMSCNPGTMNNCSFYEFVVPYRCSTGQNFDSLNDCLLGCAGGCGPVSDYVQIKKSTQEKVGRCDCTNTSCGKSFNGTFSQSLGQFGGAIASHMTNSVGMAVSQSNLDTTSLSVSYMAMTTANCGDGGADIAKIKEGYSMGAPDYVSELMAQQQDQDSLYSILTAGTSISEQDCRIINSLTTDGASLSVFERQNTCQSASASSSCTVFDEYVCEPVCPVGSLYNPQTNVCEIPEQIQHCPSDMNMAYWHSDNGVVTTINANEATMCVKQIYYQWYNGQVNGDTLTTSFDLPAVVTEGLNSWRDFNITINSTRIPEGGCANAPELGQTVNINGVEQGFVKYRSNVNVFDNQEYFRTQPYKVTGGAILIQMWHRLYNSGSSCTPRHHIMGWLTSEINVCPAGWSLNNQNRCVQPAKSLSSLECTQTVKSNHTTRAAVSYCTNLYNGNAVVCGDGERFNAVSNQNRYSTGGGAFTIQRKYSCTSEKTSYDYSDMQSARGNIYLTESGGEYDVNYRDESGVARKIGVGGLEDIECVQSCKVIPKNQPDSTQVSSDQTILTSKEGFEYRLCIDDVCPYNSADETLLQDCKCNPTNDFTKAVSILGVLDELSKDKICVK